MAGESLPIGRRYYGVVTGGGGGGGGRGWVTWLKAVFTARCWRDGGRWFYGRFCERNFCALAAVSLEMCAKAGRRRARFFYFAAGGRPSEASCAVGYMEMTRWTCVMVRTPLTMGLQAARRRVPPDFARREKDFTIWPITALSM